MRLHGDRNAGPGLTVAETLSLFGLDAGPRPAAPAPGASLPAGAARLRGAARRRVRRRPRPRLRRGASASRSPTWSARRRRSLAPPRGPPRHVPRPERQRGPVSPVRPAARTTRSGADHPAPARYPRGREARPPRTRPSAPRSSAARSARWRAGSGAASTRPTPASTASAACRGPGRSRPTRRSCWRGSPRRFVRTDTSGSRSARRASGQATPSGRSTTRRRRWEIGRARAPGSAAGGGVPELPDEDGAGKRDRQQGGARANRGGRQGRRGERVARPLGPILGKEVDAAFRRWSPRRWRATRRCGPARRSTRPRGARSRRGRGGGTGLWRERSGAMAETATVMTMGEQRATVRSDGRVQVSASGGPSGASAR